VIVSYLIDNLRALSPDLEKVWMLQLGIPYPLIYIQADQSHQPAVKRFTSNIVIELLIKGLFKGDLDIGFAPWSSDLFDDVHESALLVMSTIIIFAVHAQEVRTIGGNASFNNYVAQSKGI
jgi:hypothetical protein